MSIEVNYKSNYLLDNIENEIEETESPVVGLYISPTGMVLVGNKLSTTLVMPDGKSASIPTSVAIDSLSYKGDN